MEYALLTITILALAQSAWATKRARYYRLRHQGERAWQHDQR